MAMLTHVLFLYPICQARLCCLEPKQLYYSASLSCPEPRGVVAQKWLLLHPMDAPPVIRVSSEIPGESLFASLLGGRTFIPPLYRTHNGSPVVCVLLSTFSFLCPSSLLFLVPGVREEEEDLCVDGTEVDASLPAYCWNDCLSLSH